MISRTIATTLLVLGLHQTASAATLYSLPLHPLGSLRLSCLISNVGTKQLDVTIQILDFDGDVVLDENSFALPGGETAFSAPASDNPRTCRFVFKGGKRSVRASACVFSDTEGCVAASEAR